MRINKYLSAQGVCSRREADRLLEAGRITVDGVTAMCGQQVDDNSVICIDGSRISDEKPQDVLMAFNKPRGIVCTTTDNQGKNNIVDYIGYDKRIYPVGRLDYDTTGILLLTNDGEFSNMLTSPKNEIEKTYIAKVKGLLLPVEIKKLKSGVKIDNYITSPCKVKVRSYNKKTDTSMVEITIHEGKNHQVKKMFESINHEVLKLKREKIAFLNLNGVPSGHYRNLTPKEVKQLYFLSKKSSK